MNKNLLLTILIIALSSYCFSQKVILDIDEFKVKGNVESLNEFRYNAIDQLGTIIKGTITKEDFVEGITNSKKNFSVSFDTLGNFLSFNEFNNISSPWHTNEYIYTDKRLTSINEKFFASDENIDMKYIYKYDNVGNKIEVSSYRNETLFSKNIYKYLTKPNGKEIVEIDYDYDGSISSRYLKEFDTKGNKIKHITFDALGKEKSAFLYTYNEKGYNTECIYRWKDETGKGGIKWVSKYDNSGKVLIENRYDLMNKLQNTHMFKYNSDGLLIGGIVEYPNGKKILQYNNIYEGKMKIKKIEVDKDGTKTYKYNKLGDIIEYEDKEVTYRYDYIYDEKENWTKIIEYKNTIPILIKERVISYYD